MRTNRWMAVAVVAGLSALTGCAASGTGDVGPDVMPDGRVVEDGGTLPQPGEDAAPARADGGGEGGLGSPAPDAGTPDPGPDAGSAEDAGSAPDSAPVCISAKQTCTAQITCGTASDGCGGKTNDCGACPANGMCERNSCLYIPLTANCEGSPNPKNCLRGSCQIAPDQKNCLGGLAPNEMCLQVSLHGQSTNYQCSAPTPVLPADLCTQSKSDAQIWLCCALPDCS